MRHSLRPQIAIKKILPAAAALLAALPAAASAHGFVPDGHNAPLGIMDYVELGGIILGSAGLLLYSLDQWRKDRAKKKDK